MKLKLSILGCVLLGVLIAGGLLSGLLFKQNTAQASYHERRLVLESSQEVSLDSLRQYGYARLVGGWEWLNTNTPDPARVAYSRFNDVAVEGTFSGSWLDLYAYLKGQVFELTLDQSAPVEITAPVLNTYDYLHLTEGLPAGSHHFLLRLADRKDGTLLARSLRTDGSLLTAPPIHQTRLLGFGSSTIDSYGLLWRLSNKLGWEAVNRGIGGSTVINEGQNRVAKDVLPAKPQVILLNYGSNDWYANLPLDRFQAAYLSMLNQIGTGLPQVKVVVLGIFPRKGGNEATRPLYNQAIRDAIASSNLAGRTRYIEINQYNYRTDSIDGTHPKLITINNTFIPQMLPFFTRLDVNPSLGDDQD